MESEIERLNKMRERIIEKGEKVRNVPTPRQEPTKDSDQDKHRPMTFTIGPAEVEILNKWKENIKGVFGLYGDIEYIFRPTGGFGFEVWAYSYLADREICLTKDVDY